MKNQEFSVLQVRYVALAEIRKDNKREKTTQIITSCLKFVACSAFQTSQTAHTDFHNKRNKQNVRQQLN